MGEYRLILRARHLPIPERFGMLRRERQRRWLVRHRDEGYCAPMPEVYEIPVVFGGRGRKGPLCPPCNCPPDDCVVSRLIHRGLD